MRTEEARPVRLEDYRPPDWLVDTVELELSLDPAATQVRATLALRPNGDGAAPAPLILDGDGLKLRALRLDGAVLLPEQFVATADRLTIAQPPPRPFRLEIETVVDPSANTQLSGLYRSGPIYCTQCEAEGFRRITYFPDRPDVMAVYTTRIEAEKAEAPVLLANGNLLAAGDVPGTSRHFAVWHDPFPKPSYLFALVGGQLACVEDRFRTMSGRAVTLRVYVEPGKESRCLHAMDALKRAMRWDETAFGREYDLDIFMVVAVSDFNMGAMENKGLNIFNDKYVLASPETATDGDYERIEAIIAHEYFHNWTGNRITCRDWFQLCLKEGLTVFRDQEFSADMRSRAVERISDVRGLRTHQFVEDAGPLAHPVRPQVYHEINNFYTTTVYEKGAEVVRMLKVLLGPQMFRAGMDLYFDRHDGEAATIEQFVQCFADVSGADLGRFMRWYSQAGTPEVVATGRYDAPSKSYRLELAQTVPVTPGQPSKQPMVIPLAVGLVGPDGRDLPLRLGDGRTFERGVLTLTEPAETFVFEDVGAPPVPSLNRGFSAPIKLAVDLGTDDLKFLAAHDCDPFNRWQALQTLATRLLVAHAADLVAGRMTREDDGVLDALDALLADAALEPAFVALALTLPGEADVAREIGRDVDPDAIFAARSALRVAVGTHLAAPLFDRYRRLSEAGPYRPDAQSAGRRALRNACLDLLVATRRPEAVSLAAGQYRAADNMTDRMAALAALSLCDVPERAAALDDFYARYAGDPLIVDKWFTLQAAIPEPATLDRVNALTKHPAFSLANPNRVRALIHAFASMNQKEFNRADGAGYDFIAETVLALDPKNPQVSARLATIFRTWRTLEDGRRG
ncbi:MAG: aminopeptidase N, partial [Xanthobacteraceae bacterium]